MYAADFGSTTKSHVKRAVDMEVAGIQNQLLNWQMPKDEAEQPSAESEIKMPTGDTFIQSSLIPYDAEGITCRGCIASLAYYLLQVSKHSYS